MERPIFVLIALLVNALFAGPRKWLLRLGLATLAHYPASVLRNVERKLNREHRSKAEREMRGLVVVVAALAASLIAGWMLAALASVFPILELAALALLLPVRPSWDMASDIRVALKRGDLPAARQVLAGGIWRYHALMDEYSVARAAIEMLAVHFSEKIVAPALWYMVFGLPGLLASKCIFVMQQTLMRPLGGQAGFNHAASALHAFMHYLPSRLAALLWVVVSAFLPAARWQRVMRGIGGTFATGSPLGLSLAAAAVALGLSLGGPTSAYASEAWVGQGTARPTHTDIRRAQYLFALLHLFLFIVCAAFI